MFRLKNLWFVLGAHRGNPLVALRTGEGDWRKDAMSRFEKLVRNLVRRCLRAKIGGTQILTWVMEELTNEVDEGRKYRGAA